jgi:1-phosphatidylinositol-3-phosphate 5-kinase
MFAQGGKTTTRGKPPGRSTGKEKVPSRPPSTAGNRPTFRRVASGPGSKVGNIAKHFERINKETERANRRYAVIRGRRARPVASARAKVEVLDSVKDAIRDESESSDSSSEADDEGGDEDDGKKITDQTIESSPEASPTLPEVPAEPKNEDTDKTTPSPEDVAAPQVDDAGRSQVADALQQQRPPSLGLPPSPFLNQNAPGTPPTSDLDSGTERNSILKALSGFWPQQLPQSRIRAELDGEDPISDPEHIFRDSSMVVRTDEPTSIIALALK